jgi:putative membrane protein
MSVSDLPALNATLNTLSTIFLAAGFWFIKRGNKTAHRNCMVAALTTSALFLASYLYYHFYAGRTVFKGPPLARTIYLTILLTHTILAVVIVPMILMTLNRAVRGFFERHKAIARWTWPLWMYVSVTGVVIYLMLYHIYPSR